MLIREIDKQKLQAIFSTLPATIEVWAYGSRVNGNAHSGSDLDLVLRQTDHNKIEDETMAGIREQIQESTIPILVEVRDWAVLPESFKKQIDLNKERF